MWLSAALAATWQVGPDKPYTTLTFDQERDANFALAPTHLLGVDPQLAGVVAGDCEGSQLAPPSTSPVIDAGDPSRVDPDQSRSDIGAFGGPDADTAFWEDADGWITGFDCETEHCNERDDDCDGQVDDGLVCDTAEPRWPEAVGCACGHGRAGGWVALLALLASAACRAPLAPRGSRSPRAWAWAGEREGAGPGA